MTHANLTVNAIIRYVHHAGTCLNLSHQGPGKELNALTAMADASCELADLMAETVCTARDKGASWQAIGDALGVTKQSAWEKYRAIDPVCGPAA